MSAKIHVTDPLSNFEASVVKTDHEYGLVVATHPLKTYTTKVIPFVNSTYGINMNQDASAGGTPLQVHDGIDNTLWTASAVAGVKFTFDSADQNHTGGGSQSILSNNAALNDTFQIASGSSLDLSGYSSLSFWVYVDSYWTTGDEIDVYGWDTATAQIIGDSVSIGSYFVPLNFGVWQQVIISLEDLSLTNQTIDALRFAISGKDGLGPKVYFDDIQFEETGDPLSYYITPSVSTHYFVYSLRLFFADALDTTLADASMKSLSYDKILAVSSLPVGITFRYYYCEEIINSFTIHNLGEALSLPGVSFDVGCDGTNTWLALDIIPAEPLALNSFYGDRLQFTINDDLSGLLKFTAFANGKERLEDLNSIKTGC